MKKTTDGNGMYTYIIYSYRDVYTWNQISTYPVLKWDGKLETRCYFFNKNYIDDLNYIYYICPAFFLGQPFARPIFQMSKGFNVSFLIMCLHKSSQPIDEQNLAKHASGMIESTPCHHDLHGFTTEMRVWVCQSPCLSGRIPKKQGDSFNMDF